VVIDGTCLRAPTLMEGSHVKLMVVVIRGSEAVVKRMRKPWFPNHPTQKE
jgi:hypothetical protein